MDPAFQYTLFVVLAPLTAAACVGTVAYARWSYPSRETTVLTWLSALCVGWLIANTLEVIDPTEAGTLLWAQVTYCFVALTPVAWLAFALQYAAQSHWLVLRRFWVFCIIPLSTIVLTWTNAAHHLVWASYRFLPVGDLLAITITNYGPWFWVHSLYSYALILLGAFLIIRQTSRSFRLYRRQSIWMIAAALLPIVVNASYILRVFPALRKDYTPISFAVAALIFVVAMLRYHLFDLKPVARDAVIDSMNDAMLAIDSRDRIVDANPAAQAIIGIPPRLIIGRPLDEVLSPWRDLLDRYRGQTDIRDEIMLNHDGVRRYYDLEVSPLIGRQPQAAGQLVVLREITAHRQAEAELREYTAKLEARNEELDAFAHTVANDLKQPLTALISYSQSLKRSVRNIPADQIDAALDKITGSGEKLADIVDALLLLSQVRLVEELRLVPLDMSAIVAGALERLSTLQAECHAEVTLPDHWPTALGHGPWVEEVWVNYLSNAFKYGGAVPRIELNAYMQGDDTSTGVLTDAPEGASVSTPDQRPMVRFWVRDYGPGITPEQRAEIFAPLSQSAAGRRGLGLSIAQRIVTRLGGEVGVASQSGRGSLFWFTLPAPTRRS
ncbi:MAG TPA: histidine kinase N-terminal 7TM domain-containing protein [Anaerolineae bacterium]|nr:histidine kinase N-terminal 7TM domain-containing protein [Anaerolineae bacterium]